MPSFRAPSSTAWIVRLLLTLCSWSIAAGTACAGFISTPSLNAIYGQAAFGLKPITVNWLTPGASIISARLATISDDIEVRDLFALAPSASPVVNVFFVDAIGFCGGLFSSGIVGCSSQPGNILMVASSFAAGTDGATDIAHELGHALGLTHVGNNSTRGNLMNPVLNSTVLATSQVSSILGTTTTIGSNLVQTAANGSLFINLRPIAVVVSAVPEGDIYLLMLGGLLLLGIAGRRRSVRPICSRRSLRPTSC